MGGPPGVSRLLTNICESLTDAVYSPKQSHCLRTSPSDSSPKRLDVELMQGIFYPPSSLKSRKRLIRRLQHPQSRSPRPLRPSNSRQIYKQRPRLPSRPPTAQTNPPRTRRPQLSLPARQHHPLPLPRRGPRLDLDRFRTSRRRRLVRQDRGG